ncbi:hypothetical protein GCM10023144_21520 [Pigmentiphaga soli]|uniref:HTH araC/xylS-type domain-containing protein n=2 Tax=Pigmentiphaga soli TaxID=1007095 RepID=A0ABP8GYZ9_9BURK
MQPHEVFLQQSDRCYLLYFDLGFLHPELAASHALDGEVIRKAPELAPFLYQDTREFCITSADIAGIESMLQRMGQCYEEHSICSDTVVRSLLSLFLCDIVRRYGLNGDLQAEKCVGTGRATRYVKTAVAYIDENLNRRVTLSEVADAASVTPNYLTSLLRRETGSTFVELLTARRMARAADLLAYSCLRVSQVARAVGFDDADYFSRRFRQLNGCSPATFRTEKARPAAVC